MRAEEVITIIIWFLVSLVFFGIGITQQKSKEPVAFYSGEKPPKAEELTDVKKWNTGHGKLWITFAIVLDITGALIVFGLRVIDNDILKAVLFLALIIFEIGWLIFGHEKLIDKYKI